VLVFLFEDGGGGWFFHSSVGECVGVVFVGTCLSIWSDEVGGFAVVVLGVDICPAEIFECIKVFIFEIVTHMTTKFMIYDHQECLINIFECEEVVATIDVDVALRHFFFFSSIRPFFDEDLEISVIGFAGSREVVDIYFACHISFFLFGDQSCFAELLESITQ